MDVKKIVTQETGLVFNKLLSRLLKLFFYALYYPFNWTYDWIAAIVSVGLWKKWVFTVIPFLDRQTILEIGHGPGHLLCKLGDLGKKVYGLDLSLPMSRQARQRLDKLSQPVRLVNASVFEIPIKSDSFDHVVATFPTEYIYDLRTYSEIHRVLKTGGTLVILPLAWFTGKKFLERMAAILFHITGQAPQWEESALTPFSHLGFTLTSHWIKLDSSKLVIVIAQKNEDDWVG